MDIVDDAACITDGNTLARTIPAGINKICLRAIRLHALDEFFGVLGRMKFEKRLTKTCGKGRRRLCDTALCTGKLAGKA